MSVSKPCQYPLTLIKALVKARCIEIRGNASDCARTDFAFTVSDICRVLKNLSEEDFEKSDISKKIVDPKTYLDFYKIYFKDGDDVLPIYIHLYVKSGSNSNKVLVINSFKKI